MPYKVEELTAALVTDLLGVTSANGFSFDVEQVASDVDPDVLQQPGCLIATTDGETRREGFVSGALCLLAYQVDFFAREGLLESLERAVTDLRNALERSTSALRQSAGARAVVVANWAYTEGSEMARSVSHRARLRVEVEFSYRFGEG